MEQQHWFMWGIDLFSGLFLVLFWLLLIAVGYMYIADKLQTKQAVRHNYPVIGRFRYLLKNKASFLDNIFLPRSRRAAF
ncbi:hypothetical protein PEC18_36100 [Paucibacter sp. O1-1]|nr:hypothetical protein [Paucibacter sp. O1-1]MDA3831079.1 hypothetical protein [Paucibacter sp. O1-1]